MAGPDRRLAGQAEELRPGLSGWREWAATGRFLDGHLLVQREAQQPAPASCLRLGAQPWAQVLAPVGPGWAASPQTSSLIGRVFIHDRMGCQVEYISVRLRSRRKLPLALVVLPLSPPLVRHLLLCPPHLLPSLHHSKGQALARGGQT